MSFSYHCAGFSREQGLLEAILKSQPFLEPSSGTLASCSKAKEGRLRADGSLVQHALTYVELTLLAHYLFAALNGFALATLDRHLCNF